MDAHDISYPYPFLKRLAASTIWKWELSMPTPWHWLLNQHYTWPKHSSQGSSLHTIETKATSLNRKGGVFNDVKETAESLGGPEKHSRGYTNPNAHPEFSAKTSDVHIRIDFTGCLLLLTLFQIESWCEYQNTCRWNMMFGICYITIQKRGMSGKGWAMVGRLLGADRLLRIPHTFLSTFLSFQNFPN